MSEAGGQEILTLEPLIEAVRDGVEAADWVLSGMQKTTSHQFEGRWQGESTRSAYLFFHRPDLWETVSVDVYLDETPRGLQGNLALVADGSPLSDLGDPSDALRALGAAASEALPAGYTTPVTLRVRLPDGSADPEQAQLEIRFKLRIPSAAIEAGPSAVSALSAATVRAFQSLACHPAIQRYVVVE